MSEQPMDEVMKFIRWLIAWKGRFKEPLTDRDFYVVGYYACFVADTQKEDGVHE